MTYKNKEEYNAWVREYRKRPEVKAKISEIKKRQYQKKRKEILQYKKEYHTKNRTKILEKKREYAKKPEVKEHRREYGRKRRKENPKVREYFKGYRKRQYKNNEKFHHEQDVKTLTYKKLGSAKKYNCILCDSVRQKVPAHQWHHFTNPYQFDKAIPLCKWHHKKVHY